MKPYTKSYMTFFGYKEGDYMPCEIPDCYVPCNDIHHITARGMGGNPKGDKDDISNIMGICRKHHERYGDKKEFKNWLKEIHLNFMKEHGKVD